MRLALSKCIFSAALFLAAAGAATGQQSVSMRSAAASNVSLLTRICADVMLRRAPNGAAFVNAGFSYRGVDRGVNQYGVHRGTGHYFDAPADTAKASVNDPNVPAGICTVYTTHLNETEFATIVGGALGYSHPNVRQTGPKNWTLSVNGNLPLIISVGTVGTQHRYEAPGTVWVSMSYPG